MTLKTADLCDQYDSEIQVVEPMFADFGGAVEFAGQIHTVKTFEDTTQARAALESPGDGKVLVLDGGGSLRCALLGGNMAELGRQNGWSGVLVNGCIRDTDELIDIAIGVKALATHPRRSFKRGQGETNVVVQFGGVTFRPGDYLYADEDGIVVSQRELDSA